MAACVPDIGVKCSIHIERLLVAYDTIQAEQSGSLPAAIGLRDALAGAGAAFEEAEATGALDARERVALAGLLGCAELWLGGPSLDGVDAARVVRRLKLAFVGPNPFGESQFMIDAIFYVADYASDPTRPLGVVEVCLAMLSRLAAQPGLDGRLRTAVRGCLASMLLVCSARGGDLRGRGTASDALLRLARDLPGPDAEPDPDLRFTGLLMSAMELLHAGEFDAARALLHTMNGIRAEQPLSPWTQQYMVAMLDAQRRSAIAAYGVELPELTSPPGDLSGADPTFALGIQVIDAVIESTRAANDGDPARLRASAERVDVLAGLMAADGVLGRFACRFAADAWLKVARSDPADRAAGRRAADRAAEMLRTCDPDDPLWSDLALSLAESRRLAGGADLAGTRRLGRAALAGYARQVLLQSGYGVRGAGGARRVGAHAPGGGLVPAGPGRRRTGGRPGRGARARAACGHGVPRRRR